MVSILNRARRWLTDVVLGLVLALIATGAAHAQVAAGPGAWSANQTWAADTVNGGNLTGYFYWPATQPAAGRKRALVLVLHGCAQTAGGDVINSSSDGGFNWKTAADQYGAIILAPNATGNLYANHCWDYASTHHNRDTGHDGVLLDLIRRFSTNTQYAIDPNQIYVAGLSSGGGETMALGCLAPDVFAGVGINAGPALGTTTAQISYVPSGFTATTAANSCRTLAGKHTAGFATQIASVVWGTSDYVVSQQYGTMDAQAMRLVYGGAFTQGPSTPVATGGASIVSSDASGKPRTAEMSVSGMGHAWPAGSGGQTTNFVDAAHVNYPAYLMDFWFRNNLRTAQVAAPVVNSCSANVAGSTVTVSGSGTDAAGAISSWRVVLNGPNAIDDAAAGSGAGFSKSYTNIAGGYYTGSVTATDSGTGLTSAVCPIAQFLVGSAPALQPPAGLAIVATTSNSIALTWTAASGAASYNVYRNGSRVNASPVTATSYTDTGLAAATSYSYRVASVAGSNESALSAAVTATTGSSWTCSATTASNYAHVQAGRAHDSGGVALANGSNQNMGLDNLFYTSTLAQTAPGYYVIGSCL